jgi:glycosyltransferase involved in cell wall biosynthesis
MIKTIKNHNIICFGSANWAYNGFQQTVMRLFAENNRIIYVNAIGARKASFNFAEFGVYAKRALKLLQKNNQPTEKTVVCNPQVLPLVYNNFVGWINRFLLKRQFSKILPVHNFESYLLWIGTPTAANFVDLFSPLLTIYNPVDRFSAFPFVVKNKIMAYEEEIARKADLIIGTSGKIREDLLPYNDNCHAVRHGVHYRHFKNGAAGNELPDDLKGIQQPIIGFFGGLTYRVNFDLIRKAAMAYPEASIVLLGEKKANLDDLNDITNIHILGFKDFAVLPAYLKHFKVCLIPYHVNELTEGVDPIKLREYLCLGKAVVSVDLPEVRELSELVYIGADQTEFIEKIGNALKEDDAEVIGQRMALVKKSDWSIKIQEIAELINDSLDKKM